MIELKNHSHETLRGHILPNYFDVAIREDWRSTRYWEALGFHHAYSDDRPALLAAIDNLFQKLGKQMRFFPTTDNENMSILDIGCGTGEVSSAILAKLKRWTWLEYMGIDKNPRVLGDAFCRLEKMAKPNVQFSLQMKNYNEEKWSNSDVFKEKYFDIVWMIHSGYYVEKNHIDFLERVEQLTTSNGLILLIHNPAGNKPYLAAAKQIGLKAYRIQYKRQICLPKLPATVFAALGSDNPFNLEEFSQLYAKHPEARALRLLLEFYVPEYPLEFLLPKDRCVYIENWKDHLQKNDWKFINDHELLLLLPRHHDMSFRKKLETILTEGFTNDRRREIFRYNR